MPNVKKPLSALIILVQGITSVQETADRNLYFRWMHRTSDNLFQVGSIKYVINFIVLAITVVRVEPSAVHQQLLVLDQLVILPDAQYLQPV